MVVLTPNGTQSPDALRRRCIYKLPYPDRRTDTIWPRIFKTKLKFSTTDSIVFQSIRKEDLEKKPGITEMLDWTATYHLINSHINASFASFTRVC